VPFFQDEIQRAAYEHQRAVEQGERIIVGVNAFTSDDAGLRIRPPAFAELEAAQRQRLHDLRCHRQPDLVALTLAAVRDAARGTANLMPRIIDAAKARATLGEISDALRAEWGSYAKPS
jgi:methylmalonyl-CoA mutase N-terminal domain/subunit